jgi:hypothetical protein
MTTHDVDAISQASHYIKHGTAHLGGSFPECICPKAPCGGVADDTELTHCPEHSKTPNQLWHWAAECPGPRARR